MAGIQVTIHLIVIHVFIPSNNTVRLLAKVGLLLTGGPVSLFDIHCESFHLLAGPTFVSRLELEASIRQDADFAWCVPTSIALVPKKVQQR